MFWLATATPAYTIFRAALLGALVIVSLIGLSSLRSLRLIRYGFFLGGLGLASLALYLTYQETMQLLDGFSIAAAGLSLAITSLEWGYDSVPLNLNWNLNFAFRPLARRVVNVALVGMIVTRLFLNNHGSTARAYRYREAVV